MIQLVSRDATRRKVGEDRGPVLPGLIGTMDGRVRGIGGYELAPGGHADDPRRYAVGVQRVLIRSVVAGGEDDGNPTVMGFLRCLVDWIFGIEGAARAPRIVHDLDVVVLLMLEDVIEPGEREEDEQNVPGADAYELRAGRHSLVVAGGRGAERRRDPRDMGAMPDRRLAVRQVLGEDVEALLERLRRLALERHHVAQVEDD